MTVPLQSVPFAVTVLLNCATAVWVIIFVIVVLPFRSLLPMLTNRMAVSSATYVRSLMVCRLCWRTLVSLFLSGVMLCLQLGTFATVFLLLFYLPMSLLTKVSIVPNLTSLAFAYGGANALLQYLLNFAPKVVPVAMRPFLWVMKTIELAGVYVILTQESIVTRGIWMFR